MRVLARVQLRLRAADQPNSGGRVLQRPRDPLVRGGERAEADYQQVLPDCIRVLQDELEYVGCCGFVRRFEQPVSAAGGFLDIVG